MQAYLWEQQLRGPAGKPCQETWGHGPGGCWELNADICHGKGETLEAGVPEKPLFNSTSISLRIAVLKAWGLGAGEAKKLYVLSSQT